jgi:hypothetical protein
LSHRVRLDRATMHREIYDARTSTEARYQVTGAALCGIRQ